MQALESRKVDISKSYLSEFDVLISNNDAVDFLKTVPDKTFQLVVTSPPYNMGKPYEKREEFLDYLNWQKNVVRECVRVLKVGGSLCWQVGNYVENGEVFPLDIFFYDMISSESSELKLRNRIIWFFEHGLHASKRLSGRYETILWFTKGEPYVFNLDDIRVPQKYPGKTYFRGPKHGQYSANPLGKNPGDIWQMLEKDWQTLTWDIPNVKANHPEKTIHPAQFPVELVERLVLALSDPGDIVFDPYMGVGSALIAATVHNRRAVGVEKEKQYVDIALDRLRKLLNRELRYRPLGTKKFIPSGREKVSQVPREWTTN